MKKSSLLCSSFRLGVGIYLSTILTITNAWAAPSPDALCGSRCGGGSGSWNPDGEKLFEKYGRSAVNHCAGEVQGEEILEEYNNCILPYLKEFRIYAPSFSPEFYQNVLKEIWYIGSLEDLVEYALFTVEQ